MPLSVVHSQLQQVRMRIKAFANLFFLRIDVHFLKKCLKWINIKHICSSVTTVESSGVLGSDELELTVPGTTEALSAPSLYSSPPLQKPETTPSSNTSTRVSTLLNPVPPARKSSDSQPRDSRVSLCSAFRCSAKVHIQNTRSTLYSQLKP